MITCRIAVILSVCAFTVFAQGPVSNVAFQTQQPVADSLIAKLMKFFPDSISSARIAVYPFVNTVSDQAQNAGSDMAEYFIFKFRNNPRFTLVQRPQLTKVLNSLDKTLKDITDDSTALIVSRRLKSDFFVTGTVSPEMGKLVCDGRIIDTRTGVIVCGARVDATPDDFAQLDSQILNMRRFSDIKPFVVRSFVPGLGQFSQKRYLLGTLFAVGTAAGLGLTLYETFGPYAQAVKARDDFKKTDNPTGLSDDSLTEYYRKFNAQGDSLDKVVLQKAGPAIAAGILTGGIYLFNILDVTITGTRYQREFKLYYSGNFREENGVMLVLDF